MKVRWVDAAKQDRKNVLDYVGSHNPQAAIRLDQAFSSAVKKLEDFPFLGRTGKVQNTRELFPHKSYRIVYEVDSAEQIVWIRVLIHTSRRWPPEQP